MSTIEKRFSSVVRKEQKTKKKIQRLSEDLINELSGSMVLIRKTDSGNVYTYVAFDDFIDALDFKFAD